MAHVNSYPIEIIEVVRNHNFINNDLKIVTVFEETNTYSTSIVGE